MIENKKKPVIERIRSRYIELIHAKPKMVIALFLCISLLLGMNAVKVTKDNSFESMFPKDDPALTYNNAIKDLFNLRDRLIISVNDQKTILNAGHLSVVDSITCFLESLKDIEKVRSLTNFSDIYLDDESLESYNPYDSVVSVAQFSNYLNNNAIVNGGIVSKNHTSAFIFAQPAFPMEDNKKAVALYEEVHAYIVGIKKKIGLDIRLSGFPVVVPMMSKYMSADIKKMLPVVIICIIAILFLNFRNATGVFLPLLEVVFSLLWTFGLMGIMGSKISVIGISIPIILLSYGISDDLFFLLEYKKYLKKYDKITALKKAMRSLFLPHIFTSVTSVIGFVSFSITDLSAIRDFGLYTAFGIIASLLFSMFFVPALLILLPEGVMEPKFQRWSIGAFKPLRTMHIFELAFTISKKRLVYTGITLVILALVGALAQNVIVRHSAIEFFSKNTELRQADDFMNAHGGGTAQFNIVFEDDSGVLKTEAFLSALSALQSELKQVAEISYTLSPVNYIERMNYLNNNRNKEYLRIPKENAAISQLFLLYEMADWTLLENVLQRDYSSANMIVLMNQNHTIAFEKVRGIIDSYIQKNSVLSTVSVQYAGFANINLMMIEKVVASLRFSILLSLGPIFLFLWAAYRSSFFALVALFPIVLSIATMFALMSLFNIPLNLVTCLISGIVLGMGIDFSIHLVSKIRMLMDEGESLSKGEGILLLIEGVKGCEKVILYNVCTLSIGFSVLMISNFLPLKHLGLLLVSTLLIGAFLVLFFVPSLVSLFKKIPLIYNPE